MSSSAIRYKSCREHLRALLVNAARSAGEGELAQARLRLSDALSVLSEMEAIVRSGRRADR